MSSAPVYERLISDGIIDRRHELALMRYAACRDAAKKAGWRCSSDDPAFLTAQYATFTGTFSCYANELMALLTAPHDPAWTYQDYVQSLAPMDFDVDAVLDQVGEFLAINHPAEDREEKRREAEISKRWGEHPEERPVFLRLMPKRVPEPLSHHDRLMKMIAEGKTGIFRKQPE